MDSRHSYGVRCVCHLLWMLPILALPLFWIFNFYTALRIYLGVVMLTAVMFYLTIQSMRQAPQSGIEGMRGEIVEVVESNGSRGRVQYHNMLWYAIAREPIAVGEKVRIIGNQGLRLIVAKEEKAC